MRPPRLAGYSRHMATVLPTDRDSLATAYPRVLDERLPAAHHVVPR